MSAAQETERPRREHPIIYEISTMVWLDTLRRRSGRDVTLASVPEEEWDRLARLDVDMVWLMGVWERSPIGRRIAIEHPGLRKRYRAALPDYSPDDVAGSPYCVRRYVVDERLGGPSGLAAARQALADRGIGLILDYVPNHVAPDHPWVAEQPDYFLHGDRHDLERDPASFTEIDGSIIALGRDPYFPAWQDVLQLNAFNPDLRRATVETLAEIAARCDGVRCDMAMLMLNQVFARTWGERAGDPPATDFWQDVIPAVSARHPGFLFIAEAYWDLEWELQQQGFDYCYDKRLYDRLIHERADSIRGHLNADLAYQSRLVRFLENHDEPRASATLPPDKLRAAAVVVTTLPGACLLFDGQLEGRRVHVPVQLARQPDEPIDTALRCFYKDLLAGIRAAGIRQGVWQRRETSGWPDNSSYRNLLAWSWAGDSERAIVVVNYSDAPAEGQVRIDWPDLAGRDWRLRDLLTGDVYARDGTDLSRNGLYVRLAPWTSHLFQARPA